MYAGLVCEIPGYTAHIERIVASSGAFRGAHTREGGRICKKPNGDTHALELHGGDKLNIMIINLKLCNRSGPVIRPEVLCTCDASLRECIATRIKSYLTLHAMQEQCVWSKD